MSTPSPFRPFDASNIQIELAAGLRIAHALEYIAAQIGEINERLANQGDTAKNKTAQLAAPPKSGFERE